jgi:hypothetical protein
MNYPLKKVNKEGTLLRCKRQVFSSKKRRLFSGIFRQIESSTFAYIIPRIAPRVVLFIGREVLRPPLK